MVFVTKAEGILNFAADAARLLKHLKTTLKGTKASFRVNVMNKITRTTRTIHNRYIVQQVSRLIEAPEEI